MSNTVEAHTVRIALLTPLRIGEAAEGNRLVQLTRLILREARLAASQGMLAAASYRVERTPIIPASSLKGMLRALTEKLARSLYPATADAPTKLDEVPRLLASLHHQPSYTELDQRDAENLMKTSIVHAEPSQLTETPIHNARQRIHRALAGALKELKLEACIPSPPRAAPLDWSYEAFASRYCPICLLYGTTHQAGAIRPLDAAPEKPTTLHTRTHVSIDRATRTSAEDLLYTEELVPAGTVFTTRLYIVWPTLSLEEKASNTCRQLLDTAIREAKKLWNTTLSYIANNPVELGAGKSRGQGLARITVTPLQI